VRLISATNKDIDKLVDKGAFREDFYYRLNVIPIHVPSLRERREDILLLAKHFLDRFCEGAGRQVALSPETEKVIEQYHWPGNVRELENAIERAAALCDGDVIEQRDLPAKLMDSELRDPNTFELPVDGIDLDAQVETLERSLIRQAMRKAVNSQTRAAKLLCLTPRSLRYKLDKYNMKNTVD
jgi:two-component system response regulator PilR (NtrC family)